MNKYAMTPQGQYHGPLPVRDFFPLPNVIFDLGLTAEEIAIYAFLMKCEDRRTYTCYPSYKTIGNAIGKSRNTVDAPMDKDAEFGVPEPLRRLML